MGSGAECCERHLCPPTCRRGGLVELVEVNGRELLVKYSQGDVRVFVGGSDLGGVFPRYVFYDEGHPLPVVDFNGCLQQVNGTKESVISPDRAVKLLVDALRGRGGVPETVEVLLMERHLTFIKDESEQRRLVYRFRALEENSEEVLARNGLSGMGDEVGHVDSGRYCYFVDAQTGEATFIDKKS